MRATSYPLRKALSSNSTASAFTAKIPVATEPSGSGVFDLFDADLGLATNTYVPSSIELIPFGTDANNETFDMRLWGWTKVHLSSLWIPQLLAEFNVTLGNIDGSAIAASHFMMDTIALVDGSAETTRVDLVSTANDTTGSVSVNLRGVRYIEFDFDSAGASPAAAMNCYWRVVNEF